MATIVQAVPAVAALVTLSIALSASTREARLTRRLQVELEMLERAPKGPVRRHLLERCLQLVGERQEHGRRNVLAEYAFYSAVATAVLASVVSWATSNLRLELPWLVALSLIVLTALGLTAVAAVGAVVLALKRWRAASAGREAHRSKKRARGAVLDHPVAAEHVGAALRSGGPGQARRR